MPLKCTNKGLLKLHQGICMFRLLLGIKAIFLELFEMQNEEEHTKEKFTRHKIYVVHH
jgi:hypothetical protein